LNILIATLGSHGDVHPFLGIAAALKARGHAVKVIASAYYDSLLAAMGLDFVSLGKAEDFLAVARDPDIWHPLRGLATIGKSIGDSIPRYYQAVADHAVPGKTVLVYSTLAFGVRIAQEKLGLPGVSVHLSPSIFSSAFDSPKLPGMHMPPWMPRRAKRAIMDVGQYFVVDRILGKPVNAFRAQLGLRRVRGILRDWIHSPQRVIGLFPAWYAAPQPDWPKQTVVTAFPLFDETSVTPLPNDIERFLQGGAPPIVFTPGSANMHGHDFFAAGVDACTRMNRRGLLLTRHVEQIPTSLPSHVMHAPYAPFSQLLPRAAALVHHGGIGTTAQGLSAGIPQLMMPMGFDQPDNLQRIQRLGVGDGLAPAKFTGRAVAEKLDALLCCPAVAAASKDVAMRFKSDPDPLAETIRRIEELSPTP
jgi:UDP:flavonoid glycosyltransferase YjiC (YdhE family)